MENASYFQIIVTLGIFIATRCGNISKPSMSFFYIDIKSMSGNKMKFYSKKLNSVFYRSKCIFDYFVALGIYSCNKLLILHC